MKVNTGELERQASELQAVAGKVNDIQDSVLRIMRNLSRQQFGERFVLPLTSAAMSVSRRSDELKSMRNALRQIAQLYERTEMNIKDEAEHATVHHEQSNIGSVPIPDIGPVLNILDRNYPVRPVERNGNFPVPGVVPMAIVPVLRDLIQRWQNQNRNREESPIERAIDDLEEILQDQYGGDGASRRQHLRDILNDMTEHLDDGVDQPDLDSIVEDVARIGRESFRDVFNDDPWAGVSIMDGARDNIIAIDGPDNIPGTEPIPQGFRDALRDAVNDTGNGVIIIDGPDSIPGTESIPRDIVDAVRDAINPGADSGYHPPHSWSEDIPTINPGDIFNDAIHDNTPPSTGNLADIIAEGGAQIDERIFQPLGPGGQAPTAADIIRDAVDVAADIIADAGINLDGRPIASLDPVGSAIADGVGNIDWTPWNP